MDGQFVALKKLAAFLGIVLLLVITIPAIIVLAVAVYLRVAVLGFISAIRYALGVKTTPAEPMQPPHVYEMRVTKKQPE